LRKVALFSLLTLLLTMGMLITAVSSEVDRHTPGFPQSVESLQLPAILPVNLSDVEKAILELSKQGVLSEEEAAKLKGFSNLSLQDAVTRIGNTELRNSLLNLSNKGVLSPDDVEAFLNYLSSLKTSGALNPVDELLALRALELLAKANQSPYTSRILLTMFSVLKDLETQKSGNLTTFFKGSLQSPAEKVFQSFPTLPLPLLQLPTAPQLRLSLPKIPYSVLIIAGICCFSTIALLFGKRLAAHFSKKLNIRSIERMQTLKVGDRFLEAYWLSVHIVSTVSGVKKVDSETHREYLARVCQRLGPGVADLFRDITTAYEEYRYGFRAEAGQRILNGFRKLMEHARAST